MTDSHATRDVSRDVRLVVADIDGILLTPDKVLAEHIVEMAKALLRREVGTVSE